MDLSKVQTDHLLEVAYQYVRGIPEHNVSWRKAAELAFENYQNKTNLFELPQLLMVGKNYPVDIETFLFDKYFLHRPEDEMYPEVRSELIKINNSGVNRLNNPYTQGVFTGGIGSGKTTSALYTNAYQLYVLSCYPNPHVAFGLDSSSEILIIFQSLSGGLAQSVDYARFRAICEQSHYFKHVFPFDKDLHRMLKFPNRIEVKAINSDGGAIGQNVLGGLIDELNFMAITGKSAKSIDRGTYNQAITIYEGISRRRKSRFLNCGSVPGILCLVSSKRYPGEFTDTLIEEAKVDKSIYLYDKRVWDIKPKGSFIGKFFKVFVGDLSRKARIIPDGQTIPTEDVDLIVDVPIEFKREFEGDMVGSLRDIAGVSTLARYPYFSQIDLVSKAFGKVRSILTSQETDFISKELRVIPGHITNHKMPRWVHIDLGVSNDACGIACGHVSEFIDIGGGEKAPKVVIDFILRVTPPANGEIQFFKVRSLLYKLRELGLPIKWVSFDTYQSVDSRQILHQKGFITGVQSMDTSIDPYTFTRNAFYEGRLELPEHTTCQSEFLSLERDNKKGKIDHPQGLSKDCSDAVAGVVYGISMRKEVWNTHKVDFRNFFNKHSLVEEG